MYEVYPAGLFLYLGRVAKRECISLLTLQVSGLASFFLKLLTWLGYGTTIKAMLAVPIYWLKRRK